MITEQQAEKIVERLVNRVEKANAYYLKNIGASIKKIKQLTPSEAHQLVQILKYGGKYEEIVKQIATYTGLNIKDIDDIFSNYSKKDVNFAEKFYQYKDTPFTPYEQNMAIKTMEKGLSNIVKNEMYNFTRDNVLGYTINGEFFNLRDTYNKVLDEALVNVGQGKETFDSAMSKILKDIGGSGLKTLDYESGRSVRLDSAVRMHLQSRLRELHNENQKILGEGFDADGIEISVHTNPAPDHEDAQGRQFSTIKGKDGLSEWDKLQTLGTAKDYKGKIIDMHVELKNGDLATSFRPISEYNCYHYVFAIVLGVSQPEYSEEQLQEIKDENNKKIEIDGKKYTKYECTQLQRNLERQIREQKDMQILAKASDNKELIASSQEKITQLTKKYRDISKQSGLPTKLDRLKVEGYRQTKANVNKVQKEKTNKTIYKDYFKNYWYKNEDEKYSRVIEIDDLFEKKYKPIYEQWSDETKYAFKNYAGPYYKDINKTLAGKKLEDTDNWVGLKNVHSMSEYKTEINKWVSTIDKEINKNQINENIVVWKGTNSDYYKELKAGDEFSLDLYLSTSLNRSVAETFMWNKEGAVALKINCPAYTKGMYMGGDFGLGEAEMLLGRKQKFKFLRTYEEEGISYEFKNKNQKIKIIELEVTK